MLGAETAAVVGADVNVSFGDDRIAISLRSDALGPDNVFAFVHVEVDRNAAFHFGNHIAIVGAAPHGPVNFLGRRDGGDCEQD